MAIILVIFPGAVSLMAVIFAIGLGASTWVQWVVGVLAAVTTMASMLSW